MAVHDTGKSAANRASAGAVLLEKMRLLRDTCCDKYLLLPALFFFLWQVRNVLQHALANIRHACENIQHASLLASCPHDELKDMAIFFVNACEVVVCFLHSHS